MYEIYIVPNDELDGTEEFVTSHLTLDKASECRTNMSCESPLWIILASDEKGYIKVISNG